MRRGHKRRKDCNEEKSGQSELSEKHGTISILWFTLKTNSTDKPYNSQEPLNFIK